MSQETVKRSLLRASIHMFGGFFALLQEVVQFEKVTLNVAFLAFLLPFFGIFEFARLYLSLNEEKLAQRWPGFMGWYTGSWIPLMCKYGVLRESELKKFTAAAYYWAGIAVVYCFLPLQYLIPSMLILAFGDPFARIVGIRLGISRSFLRGKSFAGCFAFFVASMLAIMVSYGIDVYYNSFELYATLNPLSVVAAILAAMFVEVYGGKYDNFFIPFMAGLMLLLFNG